MREFFFDNSLNDELRALSTNSRSLTSDEKIVINYHLAGLSDAKIRLILGRSYPQFLHIENSILARLEKQRNKSVEAKPKPAVVLPLINNPGSISISFNTKELDEKEFFVIKHRLESLSVKSIAELALEKGVKLSETKIRELEKSALLKLGNPNYKLVK